MTLLAVFRYITGIGSRVPPLEQEPSFQRLREATARLERIASSTCREVSTINREAALAEQTLRR